MASGYTIESKAILCGFCPSWQIPMIPIVSPSCWSQNSTWCTNCFCSFGTPLLNIIWMAGSIAYTANLCNPNVFWSEFRRLVISSILSGWLSNFGKLFRTFDIFWMSIVVGCVICFFTAFLEMNSKEYDKSWGIWGYCPLVFIRVSALGVYLPCRFFS